MSVHVGEVHSEITTARPLENSGADRHAQRDSAEELAAAVRRRAAWLDQRLCAEGFDD
jgi:hypothetical protein